jgi:hypothetical protein
LTFSGFTELFSHGIRARHGYLVGHDLADTVPRLPAGPNVLLHVRHPVDAPELSGTRHPQALEYRRTYRQHLPPCFTNTTTLLTVHADDQSAALAQPGGARLPPLALYHTLRSAFTWTAETGAFDPALLPYEVQSRGLGLLCSGPAPLTVLTARRFPEAIGPQAFAALMRQPFPLTVALALQPVAPRDAMANLRAAAKGLRRSADSLDVSEDTDGLRRRLVAGETLFAASLVIVVPHDAEQRRSNTVRTLLEADEWALRTASVDALALLRAAIGHPVDTYGRLPERAARQCATLPQRRDGLGGTELYLTPSGEPQPASWRVQDVGHTAIIGRTGVGKTVALAHALTGQLAHGATVWALDRDHGLAQWGRAMGAVLHDVGKTALDNPFACELSPALLQWWSAFLASTTGSDDRTLFQAGVEQLYELPPESRNWHPLVDLCTRAGLPTAELERWSDGDLAHVLAPGNAAFHHGVLTVFDLTAVYQEPLLLAYLLARFSELTGPRVMVIDEAWAAFSTPTLAAYTLATIRVARKLGLAFWFASQMVDDLPAAALANCPTRVLFPAQDPALYAGLNLSPELSAAIAAGEPYRDMFLVADGRELRLRFHLTPHTLAYHRGQVMGVQ